MHQVGTTLDSRYPIPEMHQGPLAAWIRSLLGLFVVLLPVVTGCTGSRDSEEAKPPRPIDVMVLERQPPPNAALESASAASWKTEDIGFEVSGRVEWVIEPGEEVEARRVDDEGRLVAGTPIARLESERYSLQVKSAEAEVERALQNVASAKAEADSSIPAEIRAADAALVLAKTELDRSTRLASSNAGSQADVDADQAELESAQSRIEQLKASLAAKQAEVAALEFQVEIARQTLRDAKRNLTDCTLYSSFDGQIADVSVVPGSVVSPGNAVATVQMMDPIKIELEVSAKVSRQLRNRQRLTVHIPGSKPTNGFLYLIDPTADPDTRTFTVTLLVLNERSIEQQEESIPVTSQTWRLDLPFLPGAKEGKLYIAERALQEDESGYFLWRVLDMTSSDNLPEDGLLKVAKMRVEKGETRVPFLGNWFFQEIFVADEDFDAKKDIVAGRLAMPDGDSWAGDSIRISRDSQWMVRPGDVLRVDLSDGNSASQGIYVPVDAVCREAGKSYVFVVQEKSAGAYVVERTEVRMSDPEQPLSSMIAIEAIDQASPLEGKRIATAGAHYLMDQEKVLPPNVEGTP